MQDKIPELKRQINAINNENKTEKNKKNIEKNYEKIRKINLEIDKLKVQRTLGEKKAGIKPVADKKKLSEADGKSLVERLYTKPIQERKEKQLKQIESLKKEFTFKPKINQKPQKMVKKSAMLHGAIQSANMAHDIYSLKIPAGNQILFNKLWKPSDGATKISAWRALSEGKHIATKKQVYKEDNGMFKRIQNAKPKVKCWTNVVQKKRDAQCNKTLAL